MKHRVKIEVPLSGIDDIGENQPDSFTIPPPCFYCGEPIPSGKDGYFDINGNYNIKFWGYVRDTMKPKMGNVIDAHGNYAKGKYSVKVPYCTEHIKPVRTFTLIDSLAVLFGTLFGVGLVGFFGADFLSGTPLILAFISLPLIMAGMSYSLGKGIKPVITKISPKLKDYASHKGHYGICSHGVRIDGGEEMKGPIQYYLQLAFCHPEGARRFLTSNPGAIIISGERFLGETG